MRKLTGAVVYPPLLAAGLIDRPILMTSPVLLGNGNRIFDGLAEQGALRPTDRFVSDRCAR